MHTEINWFACQTMCEVKYWNTTITPSYENQIMLIEEDN